MGMKKEPIITKKAGKFQPNLSQNLIYYQVTLYGVYLKVNSLYQITLFYVILYCLCVYYFFTVYVNFSPSLSISIVLFSGISLDSIIFDKLVSISFCTNLFSGLAPYAGS